MEQKERDRLVGLMHVACRRLRHAIEVLDKDVPDDESARSDLESAQAIVNELVEKVA